MNHVARYVLRAIAAKLLDWSDDSASRLKSGDEPNGPSRDSERDYGRDADFERADTSTLKLQFEGEEVPQKARSKTIRAQLANPQSLRSAWVVREILGPPKALRPRNRSRMQ